MLVMGHTLLPDQGLVGRAFTITQPVIVPDVNTDAGWLPDRLLPDTRSSWPCRSLMASKFWACST